MAQPEIQEIREAYGLAPQVTHLSESRMPEFRMPGSMSGVWNRSHGRTREAPPNERGSKQICSTYSNRAHTSPLP